MEVSKHHVIVSHIIHCFSCKLISKKSRITFDKGIQMFLFVKMSCNALNFIWRAAMQSRYGCRITDIRRNRFNIFSCHLLERIYMIKKPLAAFLKYFRILCFHHIINKIIYFRLFNSCKVITNRNIKLEAVLISKTKLFCNYVKSKPCFNILVHCVGNVKFCGPLAVIAFIFCKNTRFVYTGCKLRSVHFLNSFQLEKTCASIVGSYNILYKLCVRPCRRSNGIFQFSSK